MRHYEELMKQEDHKNMKALRELLPKKSDLYYSQNTFANNSEQKDLLSGYTVNISLRLKNIEKSEDDIIENAMEVGRLVLLVRRIIKEINASKKRKVDRISQTRYWQIHFGKKINRINECSAIRRAIRSIKEDEIKNYNSSQLIKIGQMLNSKNKAKKEATKKALKIGTLRSGKKFAGVRASKISEEIKKDFNPVGSIADGLSAVESQIRELSAKIKDLNELTNDLILRKEMDVENRRKFTDHADKLIKPAKCIGIKAHDLHATFLPKTVGIKGWK